MFTGIIEEIGTVMQVRQGPHSSVLTIRGGVIFSDLKQGDSVAVNGVCLTVTQLGSECFSADIMHETLNRSSLGHTRPGSRVNLERAMAANGRFGGHIVSGHIDGTGEILKIERDDNAIWYTVKTGLELIKFIVEKGSVAIDGISLTVATVSKDRFQVSIIPHTAGATILGEKRPGDRVNLENDIIGKYIERLLYPPANQPVASGLTREFLSQHGF